MLLINQLIIFTLFIAATSSAPLEETTSVNPKTKTNTENVPDPPKPKPRQMMYDEAQPMLVASRTQQFESSEEEEEEHLQDLTEVFHDDGEMMQPAANIIFRPLFSYRTLQAKRRRYNNYKESSKKKQNPEDNLIKRSSVYTYTPQEYPYLYSYPNVPFYYYNGFYYYPNFQ